MATILIVDDYALNREFLHTLLSYQHHQILEAVDGREALQQLEQHLVDLVITDILMPNLDGYELAQAIRVHPVLHSLPIIFYTATYRLEEANMLGRACQVQAVLTKPAEPADILRHVNQILQIAASSGKESHEAPARIGFKEKYLRDFSDNLSFFLNALMTTHQNLDQMLKAGEKTTPLPDDTLKSPIQQMQKENQKLALLTELVLSLVVENDLEKMLPLFNQFACRIVDAQLSITALLTDQPNQFKSSFVYHSESEQDLLSDFLALDPDLWQQINIDHHPVRLDHLPSCFHSQTSLVGFTHQAFLGVPISSASQHYGIFCLVGKTEGAVFTSEDERFALTLASAFGALYEKVQLYETIQQHAVKLQLEVTERQKTEHALRQSELQFRQFAKHIQDVFWITSHDGQDILYVSPAFETIWGRPLEELYQNPHPQFLGVHSEDLARVEMAFSQLTTHHKKIDMEYRICRPDGSLRWVHVRGFPITDSFGKNYRNGGITSDITQQKEVEALARQHRADLERIHRTSSMGEMASTLAHEINQPLTAISGYVGGTIRRLEEGMASTSEMVSVLQKARQNVALIGEIIHRMKNFVRSGELHYEKIAINTVVKEAASLMDQETYPARLLIQFELTETLPLVMIDRIQIQQVLWNLIRNSAEAMLERQQSLLPILLKTYPVNAHTLAVSVQDQGPGISPEIVEQLFKPYFTTKSQGMGMGLAICRTIVEAHGGQISVVPVSGKGVCFQFTLPVIPEE
jgi:PAS domain S-box-containing protein